jgi:lysozyme
MTASQNCINLIKLFEGYKAKSYLCPASVVTIGFGSTMYTDGRKIKLGDTINEQQANELLMWELRNKALFFARVKNKSKSNRRFVIVYL